MRIGQLAPWERLEHPSDRSQVSRGDIGNRRQIGTVLSYHESGDSAEEVKALAK